MRGELTHLPMLSQGIRKREASGLARIILDYGNFAISELGTSIGIAVNQYCAIADG